MPRFRFSVFLYLSLALLGFSCSERAEQTDQTTEVTESQESANAQLCYRYASERDSVRLYLQTEGRNVAGNLIYNLDGKDRNNGTLDGEWHNDTLYATYTFQSEGVESEREVAFLRQGDALVEGFGEVMEENGGMRFVNRRALAFDTAIRLEPTDCGSDAKGCVQALGYTWSALRNSCVQPEVQGIRMNDMAGTAATAAPAYLIFSEDQQRVELFLPNQSQPLLLERKGEEGGHHWEQGTWKLFPWKGYVLRQNDTLRYSGR